MDLETDVVKSKRSCAANSTPLKSVEYLPLVSMDDVMDRFPWD